MKKIVLGFLLILMAGCGGSSNGDTKKSDNTATLSKPQTNKIDTPPMPDIGG